MLPDARKKKGASKKVVAAAPRPARKPHLAISVYLLSKFSFNCNV